MWLYEGMPQVQNVCAKMCTQIEVDITMRNAATEVPVLRRPQTWWTRPRCLSTGPGCSEMQPKEAFLG